MNHVTGKKALRNAADSITLSALNVDVNTGLLINPYASANNITLDSNNDYTWEGKVYTAFDLTLLSTYTTLRLNVVMDPNYPLPNGTAQGTFGIGILQSALQVLAVTTAGPDYLTLVSAQVYIQFHNDVVNNIEILVAIINKLYSNAITIADISVPVDKFAVDNRNDFTVAQDLTVYQFNNYGAYIDGHRNTIAYGLLQLNGQDRFNRREGDYFNYVQPYQGHTHTPADGLNTYLFALKPEEHQPSGTCNFSRIDTAQLNLDYIDLFSGSQSAIYQDPDDQLYIYTVNYNVLRIMSGMGGLAYSN